MREWGVGRCESCSLTRVGRWGGDILLLKWFAVIGWLAYINFVLDKFIALTYHIAVIAIHQWCWSLISSIECTCTKRLFLNMCVFSMDAFLRNGICSVFGWTLRRLHSSMVLEFDRKHSIFYLCLMASWVYEGVGRWAFVRVAHLREWGDEEVCIFAIWLFKWVAMLGWLA